MRRDLLRTLVFSVAMAGLAVAAQGTVVVTEFAENAYVNTNGWDFGSAKLNTGTYLPGSVKMGDSGKGLEIISPVYAFDIARITIGTAGSGSGVEESSVLLYGAGADSEDWTLLNRDGIHPANSNTKVQTNAVDVVAAGMRQVKVVFNKVNGTLRVTTFAVSDGEDEDDPSAGGGDGGDPPPDGPVASELSLWRMSEVVKGGLKEDFSSLKTPKSYTDGNWTNYVSVCGIGLYTNQLQVGAIGRDTGSSTYTRFYVSGNDGRKSISMLAKDDKGKNVLSMVLAVTNDMACAVSVTGLAYTACQWTNKNESVSATLECAYAKGAADALAAAEWQGCPEANFEASATCKEATFESRSADIAETVAPGELFLFRWTVEGKPKNPMLGVTDIVLGAGRMPMALVLSVR